MGRGSRWLRRRGEWHSRGPAQWRGRDGGTRSTRERRPRVPRSRRRFSSITHNSLSLDFQSNPQELDDHKQLDQMYLRDQYRFLTCLFWCLSMCACIRSIHIYMRVRLCSGMLLLDCILFDVVAVYCFFGHLFIEISIYLSWIFIGQNGT